jgi:hypothetical protein
MVLANQNAKLTGQDQGFLVSRLVLTLKPWERGCQMANANEQYHRKLITGDIELNPVPVFL